MQSRESEPESREYCRPDRPLSESRLKKCNIAPNIIIAVESESGSWLRNQHITGIVRMVCNGLWGYEAMLSSWVVKDWPTKHHTLSTGSLSSLWAHESYFRLDLMRSSLFLSISCYDTYIKEYGRLWRLSQHLLTLTVQRERVLESSKYYENRKNIKQKVKLLNNFLIQ